MSMCSRASDPRVQYARPDPLFPPDLAALPERFSRFRNAAAHLLDTIRRVGSEDGPPPPGADLPEFPLFALESMAAAAMVDLVGVWHALGCCSGWSTIDELKPVLTGLGWFAQTFLRVAQKSGYRAVQIGEGAELRVVFVPCDDPDFNTLELKSGVYIVAATEAEIQAMDSALHMLPTSVGPENQLGGPPIVAGSPNVVRDKPTEDRDRFVYGQCCEGVAYGIIAAEVKKNTDWEAIESKQGIKAAAKRFAARHELPEPPARQSGRPRTKK